MKAEENHGKDGQEIENRTDQELAYISEASTTDQPEEKGWSQQECSYLSSLHSFNYPLFIITFLLKCIRLQLMFSIASTLFIWNTIEAILSAKY